MKVDDTRHELDETGFDDLFTRVAQGDDMAVLKNDNGIVVTWMDKEMQVNGHHP